MTDKANTQTKIIERDLSRLEVRFDRHLEIYAQNGKELVALKTAVINLENSIRELKTLIDGRFQVLDKEIDNLWTAVKENDKRADQLELKQQALAIKVCLFSAVGSTALTSLVVYIIERIIN